MKKNIGLFFIAIAIAAALTACSGRSTQEAQDVQGTQDSEIDSVGLDLDTGFTPAAGTSPQTEEDMPVISIDHAPEIIPGEYHSFTDEYPYESIIFHTRENLENFAYIEILPSEDPEGNFALLIGELLFVLDNFTPDKPLVIYTSVGSGIPSRGILFWHRGSASYFYITESGMDGSLMLVEFTPFFG